uniref:beta strand repeat-containing protein n=1 Tax=Mycobacterium sp. RTGN5 TaxID=3016522 RepID=UPI0029C89011
TTAFAHTGGTETITFTATDSYGATTQTPVTVATAPINAGPGLTTNLGTADVATGTRKITVTAADPDGDPVTITTSTAAHGTLVNNNDGTYTYTPTTAFAHTGGTETITFTATDSYGATTQTPVTVATAPINHAPTVTVTTGNTNAANGVRILTVASSDPDGDPVTVAVATSPSNGNLTVLTAADKLALGIDPTAAAYRYTPDAAFAHTGGTDTITFGATDSYGTGTTSDVTVTVAAINHAPSITLNATSITVDPNTGARVFVVTPSDPDGDPVTVTATASLSQVTVTALTAAQKAAFGIAANAAAYQVTPDAALAHTGGAGTITFLATDSYGATAQTPATFTVAPINHPPTVTVASGPVNPATGSRLFIAAASDPDGDPVTVAVATSPSNGNLTVLTAADKLALGIDPTAAAYRYTPDAAFAHTGGTDTISFGATDSLGATTTSDVTVTVAPINHAPTGALNVVAANPGTGVRLMVLNLADPDGDPVSVAVTNAPDHGTLTVLTAAEKAAVGLPTNAAAYRYTPDADFAHTGGTDIVTVTATDSYGATTDITRAITVAPSNRAPTITVNVGPPNPVDGARWIILNLADPDGDPVSATVTGGPNHGTLTALTAAERTMLGLASTAAGYRYTPDAAYAHTGGGTDSVTFAIADGYGPDVVSQVGLTVAAINHAPTMGITIGPANSGTRARLITVSVADVDNDSATAVLTAGPNHGTLTNNGDGTYTYAPDTAYAGGPETITFTATDSLGATRTTPTTFTVSAIGATADVTNGLPPSAFTPIATSGATNSPSSETVDKAFDGSAATKYLNFAGAGSGVAIDLGAGNDRAVNGLGLTTAVDAPERDPASYALYGGSSDGTTFTLISSGVLAPPATRQAAYPDVSFVNDTAYRYYRLVFPTLRAGAVPVQVAEIRLAYTGPAVV